MTLIRYIGIEGIEKVPAGEAAEILKDGGTIIYPSETLYGLGVDATNKEALKKLYKIKERKPDEGMIILLRREMLENYIPDWEKLLPLLDSFSPGPLTYVVNIKPNAIPPSYAKDNSIAFRITSSWFAQYIIDFSNKPIISTSVNLTGEKPVSDPESIIEKFIHKVDGIFLFQGLCLNAPPSTIIDVRLFPEKYEIIRQGQITAKAIDKALEVYSG